MTRHKNLKDLLSVFKKKKSKTSSSKKNAKDKITAKTVIDKTTIESDNLALSNTTCYVVQDDLLLIGTRAELEAKVSKKIGILELDAKTENQINTAIKLINDNYTKSAEVGANAKSKSEATAKLGKHVEGKVEVEAKAEVTAKAMVDLTQLLVELGVNVSANIKVEASATLKLSVVEIKAYMNAELSADAKAYANLSWKGVEAGAKATAEAKATMGAEFKSKPFKLGKSDIQIALRPSLTAYARAEAKATAAAGLKTGVSIGATAAIGLRGAIEAALIGEYTIQDGLDDLNRTIDNSTGKSKATPTVVKDKDLGSIAVQAELELSVGAEFEASPFNYSTQKQDGLDYGVGSANFKVNIPGLISGPAGAGVGFTISVKILSEIAKDIFNRVKELIKKYIIDVVAKILVKAFNDFKKDVEKLAAEVKDFGLEVVISVLDFIGKDLKAIDVEIKRRDNKLLASNAVYMHDLTEYNKKPDPALKNELEKHKAKLEKEFGVYNTYVEKAFGIQKEKINKIIAEAKKKATEIQSKDKKSKEEIKALKKAQSKTADTIKRMKELINTKKGMIIYLEPNRKVLKLNASILANTKNHLKQMEDTYKDLEDFASSVS